MEASGCCASEHLNVGVVFLHAMLLSSIDLRLESQPVIEEFECYVRSFTLFLRYTWFRKLRILTLDTANAASVSENNVSDLCYRHDLLLGQGRALKLKCQLSMFSNFVR